MHTQLETDPESASEQEEMADFYMGDQAEGRWCVCRGGGAGWTGRVRSGFNGQKEWDNISEHPITSYHNQLIK